jgi:hypothetical protein
LFPTLPLIYATLFSLRILNSVTKWIWFMSYWPSMSLPVKNGGFHEGKIAIFSHS